MLVRALSPVIGYQNAARIVEDAAAAARSPDFILI
jgi:fumarate hydratase class II